MDENEDLTNDEREETERDDVSGEEAHRIGEFRELRDLIGEAMDEIRGLREDINKRFDDVSGAVASLTELGAVVREGDANGDGDVDANDILINALDYPSAYDVITPLDDLDLKM